MRLLRCPGGEYGCCCGRVICHISFMILAGMGLTNPFLTPSICKSIHHMPGIPRMHHNEPFLPTMPIGIHCSTRKYEIVNMSSKGTRMMYRSA
jgi:hypothetical protein